MDGTGCIDVDAALDGRFVEHSERLAVAVNFLSPLLDAPNDPHVLRHQRTGSTLAVALEPAFDRARRRRGLLGRTGLEPGAAMVLAPCSGIHTFFMRFAIDVLFVRRDGVVLKVCASVQPWRVAIAPRASAAIELPAGTTARAGVQSGDLLVIERNLLPTR